MVLSSILAASLSSVKLNNASLSCTLYWICCFSFWSRDSSSAISDTNWCSFNFFYYFKSSNSSSDSCIRSISSKLFSSRAEKIYISSFGSVNFSVRSSSGSSMISLSSGGMFSSMSSYSAMNYRSTPCLCFGWLNWPELPRPLPWLLFPGPPLPPVWFIDLTISYSCLFFSSLSFLFFWIRSISSLSSLEAWTEGKLSKNTLKLL